VVEKIKKKSFIGKRKSSDWGRMCRRHHRVAAAAAAAVVSV